MIADQQVLIGTFLVVLDLVGTFVFALSGATAGIRRQLDLFGVLVLAFATANAGGITRDVLIGAIPPAGLSDWRYIFVSALAGLVVFTWTWTRAHQRSLHASPSGRASPIGWGASFCFSTPRGSRSLQ